MPFFSLSLSLFNFYFLGYYLINFFLKKRGGGKENKLNAGLETGRRLGRRGKDRISKWSRRPRPSEPSIYSLAWLYILIPKSKWWLKVRAKRARVNIRFFSLESSTFTLEPFHSLNFTFARLAPWSLNLDLILNVSSELQFFPLCALHTNIKATQRLDKNDPPLAARRIQDGPRRL